MYWVFPDYPKQTSHWSCKSKQPSPDLLHKDILMIKINQSERRDVRRLSAGWDLELSIHQNNFTIVTMRNIKHK